MFRKRNREMIKVRKVNGVNSMFKEAKTMRVSDFLPYGIQKIDL